MNLNHDFSTQISLWVNGALAFISALGPWVSSWSPSAWGVAFGILFGFITMFTNVWAKRRLVRIAEDKGVVSVE